MVKRIKASLRYHLYDKIRHHFHEVLRMKNSPHSIALGFALGTMIGILPTPGVSVIIAFIFIFLFENMNKLSIFAAIAIWNPLVMTPFYYLSFRIGDMIFGKLPIIVHGSWSGTIINFTKAYLVGNLIIATIVSFLSYFIIYGIAVYYNKRVARRQHRHLLEHKQ